MSSLLFFNSVQMRKLSLLNNVESLLNNVVNNWMGVLLEFKVLVFSELGVLLIGPYSLIMVMEVKSVSCKKYGENYF